MLADLPGLGLGHATGIPQAGDSEWLATAQVVHGLVQGHQRHALQNAGGVAGTVKAMIRAPPVNAGKHNLQIRSIEQRGGDQLNRQVVKHHQHIGLKGLDRTQRRGGGGGLVLGVGCP
ncbi:MAG: hypothetical protein FD135_2048 [Comamonadaceae bacterium]|nr:MAG: hypothetical protein FD135_2048 [Comamonadaceae bacterium]